MDVPVSVLLDEFRKVGEIVESLRQEVHASGIAQADQRRQLEQISSHLTEAQRKDNEMQGHMSELGTRVTTLEEQQRTQHELAPEQRRLLSKLEKQVFFLWGLGGGAFFIIIAILGSVVLFFLEHFPAK